MYKKIFLLMLSLMLFSSVAYMADEPNIKSSSSDLLFVQDQANILSPAVVTAIENKAKEIKNSTKAEIAVVTVKKLNKTIEETANELFRKAGIGDKKSNNGILFLIAPNDKKVRIEVGYGLEGILPDGKVGRILKEKVTPNFKNNNFNEGAIAGFNELILSINKEYNSNVSLININDLKNDIKQFNDTKKQSISTPEQDGEYSWGFVTMVIVVIVILILILIIIFALFGSGSGGGFSSGSSGSGGSFSSFSGGDSGGGGGSDGW